MSDMGAHQRFGNHQAIRRFRGFYLPHADSPHGLVEESLAWGVFDVQSLCFGPRFVLVAASHAAWAVGQGAICAGLSALIEHFKGELGLPTTSGAKVPEPDSRSIWVLQTPQKTYQWVIYDQRHHRVSWSALFSIDPRCLPGTASALQMLFPLNAIEGIEAMQTQFWSKLPS
ncbi:MAG: hypothetical protein Q8K22_11205 [Rhodoferax sp.]|nr:hypothetical protein [Rhodoferax sp.]